MQEGDEKTPDAENNMEMHSSPPAEPVHMHQVIPGLFLGDYVASQQYNELREKGISCIVAAMRQNYSVPKDFTVLRVPVDDTPRTNIIRYFAESNAFIAKALEEGKGVLVHCFAGISRSTTLVAAYLMSSHSEMTVDDAIEKIMSVRSFVEPIEFFLHQLEMYERCGCDSKLENYVEYRRFLMAFNHADMMDGDGVDELYLAYYPSPMPSPRRRSSSDPFTSLQMTPVSANPDVPVGLAPMDSENRSTNSTVVVDERTYAQRARRLSREGSERVSEKLARLAMTEAHKSQIPAATKDNFVKLGVGNVVVRGRRLRCRVCRRELALREHILSHEPGKGQQAFAIHRRDMTQHRRDVEEQKNKKQAQEVTQPQSPQNSNTEPLASSQHQISPTNTTSSSDNKGAFSRKLPGLRVALPVNYVAPINKNKQYDPQDDSALSISNESSPATSPSLLSSTTCSSYFTEPLSWMGSQLREGNLTGKIMCPNPKCNTKLGTYDWAGLQCSCGAWVTPGFAITTSKVDEVS